MRDLSGHKGSLIYDDLAAAPVKTRIGYLQAECFQLIECMLLSQ
jgi:hypothetical protein